jgi:DNA-directed RNA polymerase subunit RPC12/RpoP
MDRFPCSWKSGSCSYYEHCWNPEHNGELVEAKEIITIGGKEFDLNNLPDGVSKEKVLEMQKLWELMVLPDSTNVTMTVRGNTAEVTQTLAQPCNIVMVNAQIKPNPTPNDGEWLVIEYQTENLQRAIKCGQCGNEVIFTRLGKGSTVKCPHCQAQNFVQKAQMGAK